MLLPQKLQFGLPPPTELMWGLIIIVNYYDDKVLLNKVMFFFAIDVIVFTSFLKQSSSILPLRPSVQKQREE